MFSVLPGLKDDLIIGLPTLVTNLVDIFVARLRSLGSSNSLSAVDSVHEVMVLEKTLKTKRQSKKGLEFNPESWPLLSTGAKRQYLHHMTPSILCLGM